MGGSDSGSSSSTSTTTQQVDDRVTAEGQGIAVGGSGQLIVTDEFSDNVLDAFNNILDLAKNAGIVATGFAQNAQKVTETALEKVTERAEQTEEMQNANAAILVKVVWIVGGIGIAYVLLNSKTDFAKLFRR